MGWFKKLMDWLFEEQHLYREYSHDERQITMPPPKIPKPYKPKSIDWENMRRIN